MLPLHYVPMTPWAIATHLARFGAAGNMSMTARELRTGMAFGRVKHAQVDQDGKENTISICLAGGWSCTASTYKKDYLHPAFFSALFGDQVCVRAYCTFAFVVINVDTRNVRDSVDALNGFVDRDVIDHC